MKEIIIKGVIGWDVFAEDIRKQLPAGSEKIVLLINSEGGDVYEAFEIYNLLKDYPGKVTARVTGLAASAAADLFFGADEREWYSHSAVMYHRAWAITLGNAEELRKDADILDSLDKIRITDFAKITGKSLDAAMEEFTAETWLIGDEKIRSAGITGTLIDGEEKEQVTEPAAKMRVAESFAKLKETREAKDFITASREKIAALMRPKQDTPAQAVVNNSQVEGGAIMNINEFIAQNPGAESEVLAYAKTKIGPEVEEARKAESNRILGILTLAGVQYPDDVKQALAGNNTPEKYAVDALTKQREIEAKLKAENNLQVGKIPQTLADQTGAKPESKPADTVTEDDLGKFAQNRAGRR